MRDKFLVMSVPVTPDMGSDPQVHNDLFKHSTKGYGDAIVYVQFEDSGSKAAPIPTTSSNLLGTTGEWTQHS